MNSCSELKNFAKVLSMPLPLILSLSICAHLFSVSYEEAQIKYVWKNDEDTLRKSPSLTTLNAYLIKNQTTACDQNSWRGKLATSRVLFMCTVL